jgi:dolichol-phosphate mannosyltransferase
MKEIKKMVGFAISGGIGTIVNIAALYILTEYFGLYYILSSILSNEAAIINNFTLNEFFVFGRHVNYKIKPTWKRIATYHVVSILGIPVTTALLWVFTEIFNVYYIYSQIIAIFIIFFVNYFVNRKSTWEET